MRKQRTWLVHRRGRNKEEPGWWANIRGYNNAPRSLCSPSEAGGCQPPGGWIYLCAIMWKFHLEKLFTYFIFVNFTCLFIIYI